MTSGALDEVVLDLTDLRERVEVLLERTQTLGRLVAHPEVAAVQILVLDRDHALDDECAGVLRADHAGYEVNALEHGRPPLRRRTLERSVDADEDVPRLIEEAEDGRVARLLLLGPRQRQPGLEARVVDGRHELLREERSHRLPDEVGRRHARDPEAVRRLGRDRRLPCPGRAADEQEQRLVEPLERVEPSESPDRPRSLLVADQLGSELAEAVEVERHCPSLREVAVRAARDEVRTLGIEARHDERAGHQPFENGTSSPSGNGRLWRRSLTM